MTLTTRCSVPLAWACRPSRSIATSTGLWSCSTRLAARGRPAALEFRRCARYVRPAWDDFSSSVRRAELLDAARTRHGGLPIFASVAALCDEGDHDGRPTGQTETCSTLAAPAGTTGECRDLNMGATCDFACDPNGQSGHCRAQAAIHGHTTTDDVSTFRCSHGADGPEWTQIADCAGGATAAGVGIDPSDNSQFILNNGQTMPVVSFGFEIYGDDTAEELMGIALDKVSGTSFHRARPQLTGCYGRSRLAEREHGVTRGDIFVRLSDTVSH